MMIMELYNDAFDEKISDTFQYFKNLTFPGNTVVQPRTHLQDWIPNERHLLNVFWLNLYTICFWFANKCYTADKKRLFLHSGLGFKRMVVIWVAICSGIPVFFW